MLHFAMGNDRGKGVLLEAGEFPEGVWTHLAVSVEGRKVWPARTGKVDEPMSNQKRPWRRDYTLAVMTVTIFRVDKRPRMGMLLSVRP